ncbi:unnamed protein product, partial [Mesorhabditis belari]|uniref:ADP-ribosylhydrolase ARH3 n=1 Tax=Mesorhabditis belari TaxID=2138241 RepID=A0AAF3J4Z0_9BILA
MCSNRVRGVLMGHLIGDALGARYEFKTAKEVKEMMAEDMKNDELLPMLGGGRFKWRAGEITDDSEMGLSLAGCLLAKNGYDQATVATSYVRWIQSKPKSSGRTTRLALKIVDKVPRDWLETWSDEQKLRLLQMIEENVKKTNEKSLSNGFLMRISPLPAFYHRQSFESWSNCIAKEVTITHANSTTIDAAEIYTKAIHQLINGFTPKAVYQNALSSTKDKIVRKHLELAAIQLSPFPYGDDLSLSTNGDDQIMGYFGIALQEKLLSMSYCMQNPLPRVYWMQFLSVGILIQMVALLLHYLVPISAVK